MTLVPSIAAVAEKEPTTPIAAAAEKSIVPPAAASEKMATIVSAGKTLAPVATKKESTPTAVTTEKTIVPPAGTATSRQGRSRARGRRHYPADPRSCTSAR